MREESKREREKERESASKRERERARERQRERETGKRTRRFERMSSLWPCSFSKPQCVKMTSYRLPSFKEKSRGRERESERARERWRERERAHWPECRLAV